MRTLLLIIGLLVAHSSMAVEINSLEVAHSIPGVESAVERLVKTNSDCPTGTKSQRLIDVRFQNRDEVFTGFVSSSFSPDGVVNQCQQPSHQMVTNEKTTKLYYVSSVDKLIEEFKEVDETILSEIQSLDFTGPLLVIDGGDAWERSRSMLYKSEEMDYMIEYTIKFQFFRNRNEICYKRKWEHTFGGTHDVTCVIPL